MANNNVKNVKFLRNGTLFTSREQATSALTNFTLTSEMDGSSILARYKGTDGKIYTLVGYYADSSAITSEDSAASHMTVFDIEGSAADVKKLENMIGSGVTTTNTVTKQLQDLSGTTSDTSETTSVVGAKKYAEAKVTEAVNGLNATITADTGYYINKVDEVNGKISGTTAALPTVDAIGEAGKPITAVSENLGAVSAATGTINAKYVNVTGSVFTSSTVQAALEEIDTEYKAADAAIVNNASPSANTLAKLEVIVNNLSTNAKEYSIKQITEGLSANVKEAWGLFDADNHQSGATINIYKDSSLLSVALLHADYSDPQNPVLPKYNKIDGWADITSTTQANQALCFAYENVEGNVVVAAVPVGSFINEQEFASGLTWDSTAGKVIGVVDQSSESFLTVGTNGFKISGVSGFVSNAIEALDVTGDIAHSGQYITHINEENGLISIGGRADISKAPLNDYSKGSDATAVAASDTINQAISKLENQVDAAKAAATTVVAEGTDAGSNLSIDEATAADGHKTYKINLSDVASAQGLANEIAARKAVDGQDGQIYVANSGKKFISGATSLNGADVALNDALENVDSKYVSGVTINGKAVTVSNHVAPITISATNGTGASATPIVINADNNTGAVTISLLGLDCGTY